MTSLLAQVRDAEEAAMVVAAGFDGVVGPVERGPSRLTGATEGPEETGTFVLDHGDDRRRLAIRTAPWPQDGPSLPDGTSETGVLLRSAGRLLDAVPFPRLAALCDACRSRGLTVALAGRLELPDVPRLLALHPAILIVGRALRAGGRRAGKLEPGKLAAMRALVPRAEARPAAREVVAPRPDRIFVRDLVLSLDIGAYASERGRQQRVRISVEADLAGSGRPARAMADIVSYDIVADAIRAVATGRRFEFVETIAEEIATALLGVRRIVLVQVRVEKLDLGAGAVGIEIVRAVREAP